MRPSGPCGGNSLAAVGAIPEPAVPYGRQLSQTPCRLGMIGLENPAKLRAQPISRLDDRVVDRIPAMHAIRFSNNAERTTDKLTKRPQTFRALDRNAGLS